MPLWSPTSLNSVTPANAVRGLGGRTGQPGTISQTLSKVKVKMEMDAAQKHSTCHAGVKL